MIHKPPTDDPLSTLMLVELLYEAGVPKYALQVITGRGGECGDRLTSDPRIAGVSITGSTQAGQQTAANLAKGFKYCQLELGGNAPQIVFADADIDLAVKESILLRAVPRMGQICSASKRFIVHSSVKDEFVEKLVAARRNISSEIPWILRRRWGRSSVSRRRSMCRSRWN